MDFDLSDDQLAVRDAARDLLGGMKALGRARATVDGAGGADAELWASVVEQGWLALDLPEAAGGLGMSAVEQMLVVEELGRHAAPVPFVETALALGALVRAGDPGGWAGRLLAGEATACVVYDAAAPVIGAPQADVAVAIVDGALVVADVRNRRPAAEPAMDRTRTLGWLDLDGAPTEQIGGADAVADLVDRGTVLYSAELLGGAAAVLELAVEYAKEREQFGRPIGSFQAVKHRCADMLVDVEGMRSAVYWAAWCQAAATDDRSIAASTAKIWCADAAKRVMASGLQVHGGIGFTWEHDLHLYLKRSQLSQVSFGSAATHRQRLIELLRPRLAAGESVI